MLDVSDSESTFLVVWVGWKQIRGHNDVARVEHHQGSGITTCFQREHRHRELIPQERISQIAPQPACHRYREKEGKTMCSLEVVRGKS